VRKLLLLLLFIPLVSFGQVPQTIESKFSIPDGYERVYNDDYSKFLRQFPLKKDNTVQRSDGTYKTNSNIWVAVFDYDLGIHKTHQCADAAIYLNAMHKYEQGMAGQIKYHFTNRDVTKYQDWLDGINYKLDENRSWILHKEWTSPRVDNLETFKEWIKIVWEWAGTKSLPFDTMSVNMKDIMPGDVFNNNGHAVSVVDVIVNNNTGHKKYILAQSWMRDRNTGEEHHILINQNSNDVWYDLNTNETIVTPQWRFEPNHLIRFNIN